jgi:membrane protein DedA with SNARE-associated domain
MLSNLASWVQDVIEQMGYLGVALLVILENLFPPIPSEIVLPFAGFVAQRGDASVWGMLFAATIGSVVGAWILYGVSALIGPERLRLFIVRYGKWFTVREADLHRAEKWFDDRATVAVLIGRCVPIIRSIVSIPAGFRRMKLVPFTILTALGSLAWNLALIGAGAILGDQWDRVENYVGVFQWLVVVVILWFVLRFTVSMVKRRKAS